MFNPWFRGSSQGEEIDFALRLKKKGLKIFFQPKARVFHDKHIEGGCRSAEYVSNFFKDHCFNEGLFFGSHGRLLFLQLFLRRMKNFIEFHSRNNQTKSHNYKTAAAGVFSLFKGFTMGILYRFIS